MVVCNFDIKCISPIPAEAESPLAVDEDAVLSGTISGECFQSVAGRNTQSLEIGAGIEKVQL